MVELAYPCLARKFVGLNMGKLAQPCLAPRGPVGAKNAISAYSLGCAASARTHKKLEKSWGDVWAVRGLQGEPRTSRT